MENFIKNFIQNLIYGRKRPGLYEEVDHRDFDLGVVYKISKNDLVDKTFTTFNPILLDQKDSDFCVGFSRAYGAQATDGYDKQTFSGAFAFAASKKATGADWKSWGTSILAMCKGAVNYGICREELWKYKRGRRNYYANPANIPEEAWEDAKKHRAQSFFTIRPPRGWDMFDTMRAYLWALRDRKIVIHTGYNYHAWTIFGYDHKKRALLRVDSYGKRTLNNGIGYVPRSLANKLYVPRVLLDMPRPLAELLQHCTGKAVGVRGDKRRWIVYDGERHYLENEAVAWAYGTLLFYPDFEEILTPEELNTIPEGEPAKFENGKYAAIVRRILEKLNATDLIPN